MKLFLVPLACALLALAGTARADLCLNEVLYDPDGPDEGLEFVELWNPDIAPVSLGGILVESADGARPGVWARVYAGSPADSVPPRSAFLIAAPSFTAALQNGPDAIRLTRAGVLLDLLGYGALDTPDLFEGAPALDVPSGQSLARIADGVDTGSNASDWDAEPVPTPGLPNRPDLRLAIEPGSVSLYPEVPWPGDLVRVRAVVTNRGRLAVSGERWSMSAALRASAGWDTLGAAGGGWSPPAAMSPGIPIAAGDRAEMECSVLAPSPGRFDLRLTLEDGSSSEPQGTVADTAVIRSRSTSGAVVVTEIAFRDRGDGEWVELLVQAPIADVGAFAITDAAGRAAPIERGMMPRSARPGERIVVAESPERIRARYSLPETVVVACRGAWPALNDVDGDEGFADRVRVVDGVGIPADVVPYRSDYSAGGGSIERLDPSLPSASPHSWGETAAPGGGTPGYPNSLTAPDARSPQASRELVFAAARAVRRAEGAPVQPVVLRFGEAAFGRRLRVRVHDLLGRERRVLFDGQRVLGASAFVWDGRDDSGASLPPGIYFVRAETLPESGEAGRASTLALSVVDRSAR